MSAKQRKIIGRPQGSKEVCEWCGEELYESAGRNFTFMEHTRGDIPIVDLEECRKVAKMMKCRKAENGYRTHPAASIFLPDGHRYTFMYHTTLKWEREDEGQKDNWEATGQRSKAEEEML